MADQNCSSSSTPTPVIITPATEQVKSDTDDSNSLSSSCDSRNFVDNNSSSSEGNASCYSQSSRSNPKFLLSDSAIKSATEKRNGVNNTIESKKLFLRPSVLSDGFSSFSSKTVEADKCNTPFSLNSPKLNFGTSKFGDSSFTSESTYQSKNTSSVNTDRTKSPAGNSLEVEKKNSDNGEEKNKPTLAIFSNTLNTSNTTVSASQKTSVISVPNFVFGQNLHERVTDSVKAAKANLKPTECKSNGTSDMLFTSVLSKEAKENVNNVGFGSNKESSSLVEDAARCQEARAHKRKYEEVLVTTGEEEEENILQINVKLFAFDNGVWVERGRGILRLNDKKCDKGTVSRIVIRTVGSLRVVLNTKIWSQMSLCRASERSARLTAIDPQGQVKIYLIQASIKDMTSLYPLLDDRIKACKDLEADNVSPSKKVSLKENEI